MTKHHAQVADMIHYGRLNLKFVTIMAWRGEAAPGSEKVTVVLPRPPVDVWKSRDKVEEYSRTHSKKLLLHESSWGDDSTSVSSSGRDMMSSISWDLLRHGSPFTAMMTLPV